jgi:hypothetical protein
MARPQHDGMKGANLFVKNISKQWTLDELNELFREYGTIVTSRILIDNVSGRERPSRPPFFPSWAVSKNVVFRFRRQFRCGFCSFRRERSSCGCNVRLEKENSQRSHGASDHSGGSRGTLEYAQNKPPMSDLGSFPEFSNLLTVFCFVWNL